MAVLNNLNQGLFIFYGPSGMGLQTFFSKIINSHDFKKILHLSFSNKLVLNNLSKNNLSKYFNIKLSDFNSFDSMVRSLHKMNLSNCVIVIDSINQFYRMQLQNAKKNEKDDFRVMFSFQLKILEHLAKTNLILTSAEIYSKTKFDEDIKKDVDSFELYDLKNLSKYNLVKLEDKYHYINGELVKQKEIKFNFKDQDLINNLKNSVRDFKQEYVYEIKNNHIILI